MTTPRDLTATFSEIDYWVDTHESMAHSSILKAEQEPDGFQYPLIDVPKDMARGLLQRYARGDSIDDLQRYYRDTYVPTVQNAVRLCEKIFPEHVLRMHFEQPASWMLLFAIVCFDEEGKQMARLEEWFTPEGCPVLFEMVLKGLLPGFTYGSFDYHRDSHAIQFEDEVVSALLQPPATYSQALGAYMKQWPKLMKRHGYREHIDEDRSRFDEFPLHLALAVCAFDVDDGAFRYLPYYPRELVDYYRAHRRYTRDAWRPGVIDPRIGLPDDARPQPKRKYSLSKADAYERWIELISGEQPALIEVARTALGKRKTMPALEVALEALA